MENICNLIRFQLCSCPQMKRRTEHINYTMSGGRATGSRDSCRAGRRTEGAAGDGVCTQGPPDVWTRPWPLKLLLGQEPSLKTKVQTPQPHF